jgi:hypothetical protein
MIAIDRERARRLAWLALWVYIGGLGISAILRIQGDFIVYYRTGRRVLHGMAIYPPEDTDRFLYAPVFAAGFAPFAMMPRRAAQGAWFVVNAWALVEFIIGGAIALFGRARRLSAILLAVPTLLVFRFIGNNIEHGQINLPVLALCVWSIIRAREERPIWSGGMLAAAILIKPFALLAALYLAIRRRWSSLGWAIVAAVVLLILPVVVFGPAGLVEQTVAYARSIASMADRYRTMLTNQSAVSAVARIAARAGASDVSEGPLPLWIGMALEGVLIAAVSWRAMLTPESRSDPIASDRCIVAAFFCLMPAFAPISWKSYFAAMLVPYMLLAGELIEDRRDSRAAWALLAASALLNFVPGRHLTRLALFYSANFVSSLLLLAAVAMVWRGRISGAMDSEAVSAQADRAD